MHITDCLEPKKIINPYTHEYQVVPCGSCAACLNRRSQRWVQRLDQERYCWQYALFFTLTYNNDNLPCLHYDDVKRGYMDLTSEHYDIKGKKDFPYINVDSFYDSQSYSVDATRVAHSFVETHKYIPYLSVYDIQKFVKRIRIHIKRHVKSNEKIRYFICGEYGPTKFRPHYHGLFFFNSQELAASLPGLIREDWQFGFTDTSFVSGTNSSYVASYLNCSAHLPQIYKNTYLRPFFVCSKNPPIGTLVHSTDEVQKIFFEASPEFVLQNHKSGLFENVPLWSTYRNSLFPKITAYSRFSHHDRVRLYRAFDDIAEKTSEEMTFPIFRDYVTRSSSLELYRDYIVYSQNYNKDVTNFLIRWYRLSSRVCYQAASFGISVKDYVNVIDRFYDNCEKLRLNKQFNFEREYVDKYDVPSLIGLDELYLQSLFELDAGTLTYDECLVLQSYGVDLEKFNSDMDDVRFEYLHTLLPKNTIDYQVFKMDSEVIRNKNTKTKVKNEWLENKKESDFLERLDNFQKEYDLLGKRYAEF